ncbi:MAG TPA: tyrosine-type recombinase/integrase [Victivallales bacterium]|nr:tyrosine-type recombinase/integrase [Victivallales bacterium]
MKRKHGTGSLVKRNGTYYLRYMVNGKIKQTSLKTKDKEVAKNKVQEYIPIINSKTKEEIAFHISNARKLSKEVKLKLCDVWGKYLKSHSRPDSSEGTLGNYERNWRKLCEWLKEEYPSIKLYTQIDKDIAQKYSTFLWKSGISANTFNYHLQSIKLITRVINQSLDIASNPWISIVRKKEAKKTRSTLTKDEIISILNAFNDPNLHMMYKNEMELLFNIAAWTGLRLIDCALIKWDSVNLKTQIIKLVPEKTRKIQRQVVIPILPNLLSKLNEAHLIKNSEYIIPNVAQRYLQNGSGVKKDAMKVFKFCELSKIHKVKKGEQRLLNTNAYGFHSFRHSFASFCADSGVPIVKLSKILGDNVRTLEKYYIKLSDKSLKDSINNALIVSNDKSSDNSSMEDKFNQIQDLLNYKKKLTITEKEILKILKS